MCKKLVFLIFPCRYLPFLLAHVVVYKHFRILYSTSPFPVLHNFLLSVALFSSTRNTFLLSFLALFISISSSTVLLMKFFHSLDHDVSRPSSFSNLSNLSSICWIFVLNVRFSCCNCLSSSQRSLISFLYSFCSILNSFIHTAKLRSMFNTFFIFSFQGRSLSSFTCAKNVLLSFQSSFFTLSSVE
jgi:hypothetical protein